jgi:integrase
MRAAETAGEHPTGLAAIRLLLLTGFRRLEGLGLRREWLNVEQAAIRFPDTESGAQFRVIGLSAVELLLAQPQAAKSPFFFL